MPLFPSYGADAGVFDIYRRHPDLYRAWIEMGQVLMAGHSPLSKAERELIAAYVSALNACDYCHGVHEQIAYAHGFEAGALASLVQDLAHAPIPDKLKPVFAYVRKLTLSPARMTRADADAVFAAGWDEQALHDAIAVCCRFNFMNRLVDGHGLRPMPLEVAKAQAAKVKEGGYGAAMAPPVPKPER